MLPRLRRISQAVFLALFLFFVFRAEFRGSLHSSAEIHLPAGIRIFLESDPLTAISNALATRALYRGLLWSLLIIIPTLALGRVFCGWICPLGTLNHYFSHVKSESKRGARRIESNRYRPWQRWKYYLLIAALVAALLGVQLLSVFDPIPLTVRSLVTSVLPGFNLLLSRGLDLLYRSDVGPLRLASDILHLVLGQLVLSFKQPYFRQAFFLGLTLLVILLLNLRVTRLWCRALCPLGALLGALSRWSVLGLEKHPAHCEDCNRCLLHCQGGDDPIPGARWRKSECVLCFNCVGDCPESGIKFKFLPRLGDAVETPSLQRRKAMTSVAAGVAMLPLLRSAAGLAVERNARLIRPPGALDEQNFLARCIRCAECMKVCPNNALQPTLFEAGLEGLWSPTLVPRIGYCEPSCVLCGQACPTGAIWEITSAEKGWVGTAKSPHPVHIGTAFYDRGRCLPWAMATECIVCEEWCPTAPKAIYLRPAEVVDARGNVKLVRQPWLDPERCIGCGACEYACPVKDGPAVYVTCIGETRSPSNQILLKRSAASS